MNICHLTSVHPRSDIRIYKKEILSLRDSGHDVDFIVADGKMNDPRNRIFDVGSSSNRLFRMLLTTRKIKKVALKLDANIYHLHDPELLPLGSYLKRKGKTVVFDSHEDVPKQILSKPYLNKGILKVISIIYGIYEEIICKKFDLIITGNGIH